MQHSNIAPASAPTPSPLFLPPPPPPLPSSIVPFVMGSCLTIFGMATFRWIHGGDFVLFPSRQVSSDAYPLIPSTSSPPNDSSSSTECNDTCAPPSLKSKEQDSNLRPQNECLFRELIQTMSRWTDTQEKIYKRLTENQGRQVTDSVMELLQRDGATYGTSIRDPTEAAKTLFSSSAFSSGLGQFTIHWSLVLQLVEIKHQLEDIKRTILIHTKMIDPNNTHEQNQDLEYTLRFKRQHVLEKLDIIVSSVTKMERILLLRMGESNLHPENAVGVVQEEDDHGRESDGVQEKEEEETNMENDEEHRVKENDNTMQQDSIDTKEQKLDTCTDPCSIPTVTNIQEDTNKSTSVLSADTRSASTNPIAFSTLWTKLQFFAESNSTDDVKSCSQMLYMYLMNLSTNPTVPRYRRIYTNNNTFQEKVGCRVGAKDVLQAIGFLQCGSYFEWSPKDTHPENHTTCTSTTTASHLTNNGNDNITMQKTVSEDPLQATMFKHTLVILNYLKLEGKWNEPCIQSLLLES